MPTYTPDMLSLGCTVANLATRQLLLKSTHNFTSLDLSGTGATFRRAPGRRRTIAGSQMPAKRGHNIRG
nr:hypothetical protein [Pseudomonas luteola]